MRLNYVIIYFFNNFIKLNKNRDYDFYYFKNL